MIHARRSRTLSLFVYVWINLRNPNLASTSPEYTKFKGGHAYLLLHLGTSQTVRLRGIKHGVIMISMAVRELCSHGVIGRNRP